MHKHHHDREHGAGRHHEEEMGWGGRHGGPHGGRPDGRFGGRARRGEARFLLLEALADKPKHGYEIIKALEERSQGAYVPSPGTVYPTLQLLQDTGLISSDQDGERRVFKLTPEGQKELATHAEEIQTFWARFAKMQGNRAGQAEARFLQEELKFLERTIWSGLREAFEENDHARVRRVRELVEQCRNEVRRVIADDSNPRHVEGASGD